LQTSEELVNAGYLVLHNHSTRNLGRLSIWQMHSPISLQRLWSWHC